ncbi:class I ribonucleotide reductase maintenance protein YfaE [Buchnera aphidicola]|uniref:class I ribonucleotide reductase maintenance protein YfaE n=1 Tax=Buchnera aphidicola TaxID=9 RepID=UPI002093203D|nr:class I ribonucleotide reductase maintenance protein YfaE [Buchnera aphidicola]USS94255.1 class I ribonucleotide reductase maintenance protein YfaE [Buchnera aphidicola (Sipha maydis)]WII23804.1 class I ribonucleotide reductase maintenance protein YfaE [Buchnera aphidicola (Sipha maydis)]
MVKKIITIYKKKLKIICQEKKLSLLNILIKNNIPIDYHCQKGYCGTCRVTLMKGKILYFKKYPLASLQKNEILTCCCKLLNNITIKLYI